MTTGLITPIQPGLVSFIIGGGGGGDFDQLSPSLPSYGNLLRWDRWRGKVASNQENEGSIPITPCWVLLERPSIPSD
jgi:hypothetical protein